MAWSLPFNWPEDYSIANFWKNQKPAKEEGKTSVIIRYQKNLSNIHQERLLPLFIIHPSIHQSTFSVLDLGSWLCVSPPPHPPSAAPPLPSFFLFCMCLETGLTRGKQCTFQVRVVEEWSQRRSMVDISRMLAGDSLPVKKKKKVYAIWATASFGATETGGENVRSLTNSCCDKKKTFMHTLVDESVHKWANERSLESALLYYNGKRKAIHKTGPVHAHHFLQTTK